MKKDTNKIAIEKMLLAYDEFAARMAELEKKGNALVKKSLARIKKQEIKKTLRQIKSEIN